MDINKYKLNIWKREFELDVVYECYPDEDVLDSQKACLEWLNDELFTSALEHVKQYVIETAPIQIDTPIENIFKYVMPKSIFIPHNKKAQKLALMCNYKFGEEHSIAIVFENGCFSEVGEQDIIL